LFSGPGIGAFFQPIRAAGIGAAPTAAIQPLKKAGDEARQFDAEPEEDQAEQAQQQAAPAVDTAADDFSADVTHLSLAALRRMLLGDAAAAPAVEAAPVDDAHQTAINAYHRAEKAARPLPPSAPHTETAPEGERVPDPKSPEYILHMLDVLQRGGHQKISVPDGASIYDTLEKLTQQV
jgi:hypothetical protein